jgi:hypothetical protein
VQDRTFDDQRLRAGGLNLVVAAIVLWNTVYLERAVAPLRASGTDVPDGLLQHLSRLAWEHILLTGPCDLLTDCPHLVTDCLAPSTSRVTTIRHARDRSVDKEGDSMSKPTVTRLFFGSLIAIVGGSVLLLIAGVMGAAGAFVMRGPDVVGIQPTGYGVTVVILATVAILTIIAGGIGQFVAWIGAVLNTAQLEDTTWFIILLLLGVLSFGFIAMLAYVLAGPDGTAPVAQSPAVAAQPTAT